MTATPYPQIVAEIRDLRRQWRRSDVAYRDNPLALTRLLNDNDAAADRMRALRAKEAESA